MLTTYDNTPPTEIKKEIKKGIKIEKTSPEKKRRRPASTPPIEIIEIKEEIKIEVTSPFFNKNEKRGRGRPASTVKRAKRKVLKSKKELQDAIDKNCNI